MLNSNIISNNSNVNNFESFINSLPEKVRCTNSFDEGTKFRKKEDALQYKYIEANQLYKKFFIIDIDKPGSAFLFEERNLPVPSIITISKRRRCHYLYELNTPVIYTENARRAPQKFYEAIDTGLTSALSADTQYVGKFTKNPLHKDWQVIQHNVKYDIEDFLEYDISVKSKKEAIVNSNGRNSTIFENLRFYAYQKVKECISFEEFQEHIENQAFKINFDISQSFSDGILPAKEVLSVAKSVTKWVWKKRNEITYKNKLKLPNSISIKEKQAISALYSNETRNSKTKDSLFISALHLKSKGIPITQKSVAIHSGLSLIQVKRKWHLLEEEFKLYKTA